MNVVWVTWKCIDTMDSQILNNFDLCAHQLISLCIHIVYYLQSNLELPAYGYKRRKCNFPEKQSYSLLSVFVLLD